MTPTTWQQQTAVPEGRLSEAFWRQPRRDPRWLESYRQTAYAPHRAPLHDALRALPPPTAVLDLGCHCGVLMPIFAQLWPAVPVVGIDLNLEALEAAQRAWPAPHCWLLGPVAQVLDRFADDAFDVVVSSSCLAHVAPAEIAAVLAKVARVCRVAAVFQEVAALAPAHAGPTESGCPEWRHDYRELMKGTAWASVSEHHFPEFSTDDRPGCIVVARK